MSKDAINFQNLTAGLIALIVAVLGFFGTQLWGDVRNHEKGLLQLDGRQQRVEALLEQQKEYNDRILRLLTEMIQLRRDVSEAILDKRGEEEKKK